MLSQHSEERAYTTVPVNSTAQHDIDLIALHQNGQPTVYIPARYFRELVST